MRRAPTPRAQNILLHVLLRERDGGFTFATANTSAANGLAAYHPTGSHPETGAPLKAMVLSQMGVDASKLEDSSFWALLFRPLTNPAEGHCVEDLYSTLLPYLTGAPLATLSAVATYPVFEKPPLSGDVTKARCVLAAMRFAFSRFGLSEAAASRLCLRVRWALVVMALDDLRRPGPSVTPADAALLVLASRSLCNHAAEQASCRLPNPWAQRNACPNSIRVSVL